MGRQIKDYQKWIWQYEQRIVEYTQRTDLNLVKKRCMISNAKYKIRTYKKCISELQKTIKPSISQIIELSESYFDCKIQVDKSRGKPSLELMCLSKLLLENNYKAVDIAKELNCEHRTILRNRIRLIKQIDAYKETYTNFSKKILRQVNL